MAYQVGYASENSVQHMNITPNNAFQLEQEGFQKDLLKKLRSYTKIFIPRMQVL
jgi:hypothetical protein